MEHWRLICVLLTGMAAILSGCGPQSGGPAPAPSPTPKGQNAERAEGGLIIDEDEIPLEKQVIEEQSALISHTTGGRVELQNGFSLSLPAGSLERDATVQVRHAIVTSQNAPVLQSFRYYRLAASGGASKLASPATLRIPLQEDDDPESIILAHYLVDGSAELLSHQSTEAGFIEAEINSFSTIVLIGGAIGAAGGALIGDSLAPRLAAADEVIANSETRILHVPYYHQYDFSWCWAASAAMIFGAQHAHVQPYSIAAMFDATRTQGGCFWPSWITGPVGGSTFDFEVIRQKLNLPKMPLKMYGIGGAFEKSIRGWLILQIRDGHPVWVGLRDYDGNGNDHAVVIVGYDHVGFYVHDPSGTLIAQLEVMRGNASSKKAATVDKHQLAYRRVRYGEWQKLFNPGWFHYRPWLTNIGVIEKRAESPRTVSMQIPTASSETALAFHHNGFTLSAFADIVYYWNGEQTGGSGFSIRKDVTDKEQSARMGQGNLCNSDALHLLQVQVHNTGDEVFEGRIALTLDGTPIAPRDPALQQVVRVPPNRTCHPHLVTRFPGRATATDPRKTSYTSLAARGALNLRDALDFMTNPLHLGKHTLAVELRDSAGTLVDRCAVHFELRPAVPHEVKATVKAASLGGERRAAHEITWQPSPEEQRTGGNGKYRIYRVAMGDLQMERADLVATVDAGTYRFAVPAPQGDRVRYTVSFVDATSQYESPLAQPSRAVSDEIPKDAEYTYSWDARYVVGGRNVLVKLSRTPDPEWPEPYVIAVKPAGAQGADGQVQYVYPENAGGLEGVNYTRYYRLPRGPLPERLDLTAYFKDGSKKIGNTAIVYGRAKPKRSSDISEYAREVKRDYERALEREGYRFASEFIRHARPMIGLVDSQEEGRRLYAQAVDKLKQLYASELPQRQEEFAKDLDYLQQAGLAAHLSRLDVEAYMQILDARHAAGTAHPDEYVDGVDLLVRARNDTAAAHELFAKLKERIPSWTASLTEEELQRNANLRRDKINYTRLLQEKLAYPVPPIPVDH